MKIFRHAVILLSALINIPSIQATAEPSVRVTEMLQQAPSSIPVYNIATGPVSDGSTVLAVDWKIAGADFRQSSRRREICLNGLWAVQPAISNQAPNPDDWGFLKVPGILRADKSYTVYDQSRTTWASSNLYSDAKAIWYVRDLEVPSLSDANVFLNISSMRGLSLAVYWNGRRIGSLTDQLGSTLNLSPFAEAGHNGQLAIYALATVPDTKSAFLFTSGRKERPYDPTGWNRDHDRGLSSDVYLEMQPASPILASVQVIPSVRNKTIGLKIRAVGNGATSFDLTVKGPDGMEVLERDGLKAVENDGYFNLSIPWDNPRLWTPDDPFLYEFGVKAKDANGEVLDETLPEKFGFREIWIEGKSIMFNGNPLRLRPRLADTSFMDGAALRREFSFLKDVGFNCVLGRSAGTTHQLEDHTTQSIDDYYRIADEMGMLIIPYTPYNLVSGGQFGSSRLSADDTATLLDYVRVHQLERLSNHPSVIAYSGFGVGFISGVNYINVRPDVWGILPLDKPGILEKLLSSGPVIVNADVATSSASRNYIQGIKRLDPTRPFLSHYDGGEGDGWGIFDYFNWTPVQEWAQWPSQWAKEGTMPVGTTEHGLPYVSSFLNHGIPDGNCEPWVTEYAAMVLGPVAYQQESPAYLSLITTAYNPATRSYPPKTSALHRFAEIVTTASSTNVEAVWAMQNRDIYRAWRTYGVSMGIEPFGQSWQMVDEAALRKGNDQIVATPSENLKSVGAKLDRWEYNTHWPSETMPWLPTSPTGQKPDGLTALGETIHAVDSPLLVYLAGGPDAAVAKDHVFWSGEEVAKQIVLIWDGFTKRDLKISWKVEFDGKTICAGEEDVLLSPGDISKKPIQFPAPQVVGRGEGCIELTAVDADSAKCVAQDSFNFQVYPPLSLSNKVKGLRVVLFDPTGDSQATFHRLGVNPVSISSLAEWKDGDLLVIGRGALPALRKQSFDTLPTRVPVLVLEQPAAALEAIGFRAFPIRTRTVFPMPGTSPVLDGVDAADLRDWRVNPKLLPDGVEPLRDGYNYHTGYYGTVASVTLEIPTNGNFTPLLQTGFDLRETPLLEGNFSGRRLDILSALSC